jgi:hypothetical protein
MIEGDRADMADNPVQQSANSETMPDLAALRYVAWLTSLRLEGTADWRRLGLRMRDDSDFARARADLTSEAALAWARGWLGRIRTQPDGAVRWRTYGDFLDGNSDRWDAMGGLSSCSAARYATG